MEVLDYKKRLSGSAYAKDKMDDDDDQMDYDHLHSSDEVEKCQAFNAIIYKCLYSEFI